MSAGVCESMSLVMPVRKFVLTYIRENVAVCEHINMHM